MPTDFLSQDKSINSKQENNLLELHKSRFYQKTCNGKARVIVSQRPNHISLLENVIDIISVDIILRLYRFDKDVIHRCTNDRLR